MGQVVGDAIAVQFLRTPGGEEHAAGRTEACRLPRPRLIEQLNAGLGRKLTLVSAPAGLGKTTPFIVHPSSSLACPRALA